jgi:hypothetical protein
MSQTGQEVYVVFESNYDDYAMHGIFSSPEKAIAFVKENWSNTVNLPAHVSIDVWVLDGEIVQAEYNLKGERLGHV